MYLGDFASLDSTCAIGVEGYTALRADGTSLGGRSPNARKRQKTNEGGQYRD